MSAMCIAPECCKAEKQIPVMKNSYGKYNKTWSEFQVGGSAHELFTAS